MKECNQKKNQFNEFLTPLRFGRCVPDGVTSLKLICVKDTDKIEEKFTKCKIEIRVIQIEVN